MSLSMQQSFMRERVTEEIKLRAKYQVNSSIKKNKWSVFLDPPKNSELKKTNYLYGEKRKATSVQSDSRGALTNINGNPLNGMYLYVISPSGKLYAGDPRVIHHHSYPLAGGKVMCAGMMFVENGRLIEISNESGHYKPGIEPLRDAVRTMMSSYSQQDFECVDHSSVAKAGSYVIRYMDTDLASDLPLTEDVDFEKEQCKSRSACVSLSQHKSVLFRSAEQQHARLELKQKSTPLTKIELEAHAKCEKYISHESSKNSKEELEASLLNLKRADCADQKIDEFGYSEALSP